VVVVGVVKTAVVETSVVTVFSVVIIVVNVVEIGIFVDVVVCPAGSHPSIKTNAINKTIKGIPFLNMNVILLRYDMGILYLIILIKYNAVKAFKSIFYTIFFNIVYR